MLTLVKAYIFALTLYTTISPIDGKPGLVPLEYGAATYLASVHHGVDPYIVGAILLAEHRGRDYSPNLRGRYNGGGEIGLYQLKTVWAIEATERCNADQRRDHHRYSGARDCLYISPQDIVRHDDHLRRGERGKAGVRLLSDARVNIESAVIAFSYLQAKYAELKRRPFDWRAMFRCSPRAWRHMSRTRRQRKALARCAYSVRRVLRWEHAIRGLESISRR